MVLQKKNIKKSKRTMKKKVQKMNKNFPLILSEKWCYKKEQNEKQKNNTNKISKNE